jgi:hypothetical protein
MAPGMRRSSPPRLPGPHDDALSEFFAGHISAGEFWRQVAEGRATVRHRPDPAAGGPTLLADTSRASHRQKARRACLAGLVAMVTVVGAVAALLFSGARTAGSRTPRPTSTHGAITRTHAHKTRTTHASHPSVHQTVAPTYGSAGAVTTHHADLPVAQGKGKAAARTPAAGKDSSHRSPGASKRPTSTTTAPTTPTTPTTTTPTTPTTTTPTTPTTTTPTTPTTTTPTTPTTTTPTTAGNTNTISPQQRNKD